MKSEQSPRLRSGQASRTAEVVAWQRAAHQVLDRPLVLDDSIAMRVVGAEMAAILQSDPAQLDRTPVSKFLRAGLVVRSRVAEDTLAAAVARGVSQYLILGAGFDTFAYRNPFPAVRVFEVDHPATQAVKRERLNLASIAVPDSVALVPFDFSAAGDAAAGHGALGAALAAAGFDPSRPAVVAWLGVTMYLTPSEVSATLAYLGSLAAGSAAVFDFYVPVNDVSAVARTFYEHVLKRLADLGEPWQAFYTPAAMRHELEHAGFMQVETLDRDALNARYLANRGDGLDVGSLMQIAVATR